MYYCTNCTVLKKTLLFRHRWYFRYIIVLAVQKKKRFRRSSNAKSLDTTESKASALKSLRVNSNLSKKKNQFVNMDGFFQVNFGNDGRSRLGGKNQNNVHKTLSLKRNFKFKCPYLHIDVPPILDHFATFFLSRNFQKRSLK
jgi:hypothetical protein